MLRSITHSFCAASDAWKLITKFLAAALLLVLANTSAAQEDLSQHWEGKWIAEGTLFALGITVEDGAFKVSQIESLGFEWTNEDGAINGNIVTVEVEYAGVTGTIQAELIGPDTAVAFAATCLPDFMVVCALAKGRQAVFRKVEE